VDFETDAQHKEVTDCILQALKMGGGGIGEHLVRAANIRGFLG